MAGSRGNLTYGGLGNIGDWDGDGDGNWGGKVRFG